MKFINTINTHISRTVEKLNDIESLNNRFIYIYDKNEDWYNIIHSVEDIIQESDEIALLISEILVENLIENEILNFSMYEDLELIKQNTVRFIPNMRFDFSNKRIKGTSTTKYTGMTSTQSIIPKIA